MELQHLAGEVMARINAHLGSQIVTTLRFVQTLERALPPLAASVPPDPAELAAVEATLSGLPDGELRAALAALGRSMAIRPSISRTPGR